MTVLYYHGSCVCTHLQVGLNQILLDANFPHDLCAGSQRFRDNRQVAKQSKKRLTCMYVVYRYIEVTSRKCIFFVAPFDCVL